MSATRCATSPAVTLTNPENLCQWQAALRSAVVAHAPPLGLDDSEHQPGMTFAHTGDHHYSPAQFTSRHSLRAMRYVGFYDGHTTLVIGVREQLPVRLSSQLDQTGHIRRIVIDIALSH